MHNFLYSQEKDEYILLGMAENEQFHDRLRIVADALGTRREAAEIGGVSLDAIIRYLRGENQPGFLIISRLCEAAGISMHWLATGRGDMHLAGNGTLDTALMRGLPVMGFSETKEPGWYSLQQSTLQTTLDLPDPEAFVTVVHGQGLVPEGLQPGFMCVCSPMLTPVPGDIVHLKRFDGLCALRLFIGEDSGWLVLKAYTDAEGRTHAPRVYEDRVKRSTITTISPVVFIKRKL